MIRSIKNLLKKPYYFFLKIIYLIFGRPKTQKETFKAKQRRIKEGFFEKYCIGKGLDIGYGGDLLSENCRGWDFEHGDAVYLKSLPDSQFDFVYSSHLLEHLSAPRIALKNWWRVVKNGGYLILYLPHRDLYERKTTLPSRWNIDHKHFFLLDKDEKPSTIGLIPFIKNTLSDFKIIYAKECNEGYVTYDPKKTSEGEYSIEIVVQKIL